MAKTKPAEVHHSTASPAIPGPRGLPGLGVLPWVWKDPLAFFASIVQRYGKVVRFRLGPKDVYLISDPDLIGQVFQQPKIEETTSAFNATTRSVFGEGLVTLRGMQWRADRELLQPAFTKQAAVTLTPLFVDETRRRLATWQDSETIDVAKEMRLLTCRIITRLALGSTLTETHWLAVYRALCVIDQQLFKHLLFPPFARLPTPGNRSLHQALRELNTIIDQAIRHQQLEDGDPNYFPLTSYLIPRIANRQRVRDHLLTLLFAGQETTANALAWCLYLVAKHPNVAEKLKAAQDAVFGTALPTSDDIAKLTYTRASLEEAMRLYPPSYVLAPRNGDRPLIGERVVPPHAQLLISQYVMHRHPDYWEQPEAFKPERFEASQPKFTYFPFGAGPKVCLGAQMAMQEMTTVLAMIIQAFRLELINQHFPVPQPWVTLRPQEGVRLGLTPR